MWCEKCGTKAQVMATYSVWVRTDWWKVPIVSYLGDLSADAHWIWVRTHGPKSLHLRTCPTTGQITSRLCSVTSTTTCCQPWNSLRGSYLPETLSTPSLRLRRSQPQNQRWRMSKPRWASQNSNSWTHTCTWSSTQTSRKKSSTKE